MTPTRLKVLRHFFARKNNVKVKELLSYFFDLPYSIKARRMIKKIEKGEDDNKVFFNDIATPLFCPDNYPETSLYQVIVESFYPRNWHFYEVEKTLVESDDIVIDCGAAEGLFSLLVHKRCKEIYLIEPLPVFIKSLKKTFHQCNNVEIIPCAISDTECISKISENDISSSVSDKSEGVSINVTTLDKLFLDRKTAVSYLKMDLEGYDYKALIGAKELIKKYKPKIAVTTYHSREHAGVIEKFIKSIVPSYNILTKGIYQETGSPVMLHAWI